MTRSSEGMELTSFSKVPLLMTESAEDFATLSADWTEEIKPRGIIERMYVAEIAALSWEIFRYRRCKAAMVNRAFKDALSDTVYRLAGEPAAGAPEMEWVDAVCLDWFSKPKARKDVLKLLKKFHLDESAIEAEAIRSVFSEIELLDRMLSSLESRRSKALRCIAEHRQGFARQVREASDRVIEGEAVVRLENRSAQKSA